ncbi:glycyl-tRNA synthetase, partial [Aureobasidium melanogenum]
MQKIGIDMNKLRFRQHMANEMAHYASDCWDCELLNSYGWTECVGCADRSAYDLSVHEKATGTVLRAREQLKNPETIEEWVPVIDKKKAGPKFKKDAKAIENALEALSQEMKEKLQITMESEGKAEVPVEEIAAGKVEIDTSIVKFEKQKKTITFREFVPNVIEPSFGIGRILYSLMEHSYWTRENDEARSVLSFSPVVAPIKVLVCPLQKDPKFAPLIAKLEEALDNKSISFKIDQTGVSIGKRYSRNDELGIPFGITIDYEALDDGSLTLRDRDSTKQVRASQADIIKAVSRMVKGKETWADVIARLPAYEGQKEAAE